MEKELRLSLTDTEWPLTYTSHDRHTARGIVFDGEGNIYFMRVFRDDDFGKATLIETAGGGVEKEESPDEAIFRELSEELGVEVEVMEKIGVVDDYYNLIHRHNVNHYYLCRVTAFGETHMTEDEIHSFHLSTLKISYEDAVLEYQKCAVTPLGKLICQRELPILHRAKELLDELLS
jgi:8-oxo-dGTP pyrophosphatase MutT (NUDIX family)